MKKNVMTLIASLALSSAAVAGDLPALKVTPCDGCNIEQGVLDAIAKGYSRALDTETFAGEASVKINEFAKRDGAARVLLGVFSGEDKIAATVEYAGQTFQVDDSARSTVCGIECVGENIGAEIAAKIAPEKVEAVRKEAEQAMLM